MTEQPVPGIPGGRHQRTLELGSRGDGRVSASDFGRGGPVRRVLGVKSNKGPLGWFL